MLAKEELGAALKSAMDLKGVGPTEVAKHFNRKPPSVKGWQRKGTIDKCHWVRLVNYFGDVVGISHWGISEAEWARMLQEADEDASRAKAALTQNAANQDLLEHVGIVYRQGDVSKTIAEAQAALNEVVGGASKESFSAMAVVLAQGFDMIPGSVAVRYKVLVQCLAVITKACDELK